MPLVPVDFACDAHGHVVVLGTVSAGAHGFHVTTIARLLARLALYDEPAAARLQAYTDYWAYTVAEVNERLAEHAPQGFYFGTHPGDGCDFGYWPNEED